ncbi:unnamed protein product [Cylicocyclus nassatus]|uniref:EGF-like domain-containing protein n=1 Tax=Cylicocyclus nassatus TaxID=53992 RepID=A0AA36HFI3_CYLNA|nr:unnamed protein product [Cylicocyclus nassatus]
MREGVVDIRERNTSYELCFSSECKTFLGSNGIRTYKLPPSPTQSHTKVAIKYVEDETPTDYALMCSNPDFCAVSRSLLSTSLLGNPNCWPVGAVITVAMIFYVISMLILISLWGMLSLIRITRKSPASVQNVYSINVPRENVQLHSLNPTLFSGGLVITLCIAVLAGMNAVDACQHGFTRYSTNIVCSQNNCNLELSRELLFNRIQNEHCIEVHHQNRTVGLLKIKLRAASLTCSKESITYTRSTVHRVYSAVRCSQAGSCYGNVCDTISRNDTVPELSQARDFPGYIGCQYTCGGMSCGCLLPSPSCTFYKVAHTPVSGTVHEIIRCSEWTPSLHIEVESSLSQVIRKEGIVLTPYITAKLREFNITATSVQNSHLPVLNRRFALSSDTSLILPDDFRLPVECATRNEAMNNFKNCVNKIICDCNTGWTKHHCHYPDYSLRTVEDDSSNRLPLLAPFIEIHSNGSALSALVKDIETIVTVQSNILLDSAEFVYEEKCDNRMSNIVGCYSCLPGANINVTCLSKDPTEITISCDEISFSVQCGPTKPSTMMLLHLDSAVVQRKCHTSCGDRKWDLPLNGTLFYHHPRHDSVFKFNEEDQKSMSCTTGKPFWPLELLHLQQQASPIYLGQ